MGMELDVETCTIQKYTSALQNLGQLPLASSRLLALIYDASAVTQD